MATFTPFKGRQRSVGIKLKGLKRLDKQLIKMERTSAGLVHKQSLLAANRIARRANRDVPVDTGRLLKSIAVTSTTKSVLLQVKAPYAGNVEFGIRQPPQPFLFKHIDPELRKMQDNLRRLGEKNFSNIAVGQLSND